MAHKATNNDKMAQPPIIDVKGLTKTFKGYKRGAGLVEAIKSFFWRKTVYSHAVKDVTFTINKGEIIGFLGPNGAGKSTTIKMLSGILWPTSGSAKVIGYVPWADRQNYVGRIAALFGQKSQMNFDLPPVDSFELNRAIYSIPEKEFKARLNYMAAILGVQEVMQRPVRNLSLGERMKCEFIMAMLHQPEVVFLDEPTIGLDVFAKESIRSFVLEMNKKFGMTFILTTHDLDDIAHLAHRVIVINHGAVVFDDSMERLRKQLGERKLIHITTKNPLPDLKKQGITIRHLISPFEADITLDTKKIPIDRFLHLVRQGNQVIDVVIQEPPIEEIIKKIYRK